MSFIKAVIQWMKRRRSPMPAQKKEQVFYLTAVDDPSENRETLAEVETAGDRQPALKLDQEISFSRIADLEAYADNLNVPSEDIEKWISAGLLYPDEIRTAERMIRIIRKKGASAGVL